MAIRGFCGLNYIKYLATKLCDIVPYNITSVENSNFFKKRVDFGNLKDVIAGYAENLLRV